MTFSPRSVIVGVRFTEQEMRYVRREASKMGKLPGGWCHFIVRQEILRQIAPQEVKQHDEQPES